METIRRWAVVIAKPQLTENWVSWAPKQKDIWCVTSFVCSGERKCVNPLEEVKCILKFFTKIYFSCETSNRSTAWIMSSPKENFLYRSLVKACKVTEQVSGKAACWSPSKMADYVLPMIWFIKIWRREHLKKWNNLLIVLHKDYFLNGRY